jgi:hypothetical protein
MENTIDCFVVVFDFGCLTVATATQLRRPKFIDIDQLTLPFQLILYFLHRPILMPSNNAVSGIPPVTKSDINFFWIRFGSLHRDHSKYFVKVFFLVDEGLEFPLLEGVDEM